MDNLTFVGNALRIVANNDLEIARFPRLHTVQFVDVQSNSALHTLLLCALSGFSGSAALSSNAANFLCAASSSGLQSTCDASNSVAYSCALASSVSLVDSQFVVSQTVFEATDVAADATVRQLLILSASLSLSALV